jgi:hypothetical protein
LTPRQAALSTRSVAQGACVFAPPSTSLAGPLPGAKAPFGRSMPPDRSCSALVVSHHLDGLLRRQGRELVASRYRQGFTSARTPPAGKPAGSAHALAQHPEHEPSSSSLRPPWPGLSPGWHLQPRKHDRRCRSPRTAPADLTRTAPPSRSGPREAPHVHADPARAWTPWALLTCRFPARARGLRSALGRFHNRTPHPLCRSRQPGRLLHSTPVDASDLPLSRPSSRLALRAQSVPQPDSTTVVPLSTTWAAASLDTGGCF